MKPLFSNWPRHGLALLLALWSGAASGSGAELASPDGRLKLEVELRDFDACRACPVYNVSYQGRRVVLPSRLGWDDARGPQFANLELVRETRSNADSTWKPVYGERNTIRDHYNAIEFTFRQKQSPGLELRIVVRAYDEGVAFCYIVPAQAGVQEIKVARETTEFRLAGDFPAWATYTAQGVYTNVPVSRIQPGCERPLVLQLDGGGYAALGEARLVDFARMKFAPLAGVPQGLVSELSGAVSNALPLRTPWRFIMLAESPGRLLENNDFILNLNDPCALTNTAWIKPGKILRDRSLTTAGAKACVDFAARRNLQYIMFDAGWYGSETSRTSDARQVNLDPARSEGPLDLPEVLRYAATNGVGVILYVNHLALERQLDELFPLYHRWGVKGVKFGFVNVGEQNWTRWLHAAIAKAATHELMVDVHDEYRPTGWSRTYPNLMTQEGVRGDEERQPNAQGLTSLFTRFLAGAADNTICYYNERVTQQASHAFQLAKAVCFYSPWQSLYWYDHPLPLPERINGSTVHGLLGDEPELEFFDHCPTVWDETRVLQGEIGECGVVARRAGTEWFVGVMNARTDRQFKLPLDFLEAHRKYTAWIYSDDASVQTRTQVRIETLAVERGVTLDRLVSARGGLAVRIVPSPAATSK